MAAIRTRERSRTVPRQTADQANSNRHVLLAKGQRLFTEGDPATYFFKVIAGCVRIYSNRGDPPHQDKLGAAPTKKYSARGSKQYRQIYAFYLAGDLFPIDQNSTYACSAEAVDGATVVQYEHAKLEMMMRNEDEVLQSAIKNLERAQKHMMSLGCRTPMEKTVAFLIELSERLDKQSEIWLPMPRQDIADYLNIRLETLSRMLSLLQCAGLIELGPAQRAITVLDRHLLGSPSAQSAAPR